MSARAVPLSALALGPRWTAWGSHFHFDRDGGILRTKAEGVVNYEELYDHQVEQL